MPTPGLGAAHSLLTYAQTVQTADPNADLTRRIDELSERLHYFVSWFESLGVWVGVFLAICGLIITIIAAVASIYGLSTWWTIRRLRRELAKTVTQLQENAAQS